MRPNPLSVLVYIALLSCGAALAADQASLDALKEKGLTPAGNTLVLSAEEPPILDSVKALRQSKRKADMETRARQQAEAKIAANRKIIEDSHKEYEELTARLEKIKDVTAHNRVVTRINLMVSKAKEAAAAQKGLEEDANKVGSEAKTKFVDDLTELAPKLDAVATQYQALAADTQVKAAIAKANASSSAKLALGPSAEFAAAAADVKKWRSEIDSEAIPLRAENGIHLVEALLNSERYMMIVDTGASNVTLPAEVAEKLKIVPGEQDPTIQMRIADGNIIQGKLMSLKTIRVGRFTVENVSCVVLQKGLPNPPIILGGSFLSHFVVKLNQRANELHLTELKDDKAASPARKAAVLEK
jgi:clan AA aspartic protease (TIGR02281 family)